MDLYFCNGDPVSIRALAEASLEVLSMISDKVKTEPSSLQKFINEVIPDDKKKEFMKALNKTKNFLKHADKDPEGVLDFNPSGSSFLMHEAIGIYENLSQELPTRFAAFRIWFRLNHPQIYKNSPSEEKIKNIQRTYSKYTRQQFLQEFELTQNIAYGG